jgi:hypothetical protein
MCVVVVVVLSTKCVFQTILSFQIDEQSNSCTIVSAARESGYSEECLEYRSTMGMAIGGFRQRQVWKSFQKSLELDWQEHKANLDVAQEIAR